MSSSDILTLAELVDLLTPVASKWYNLGVELKATSGQLDNIQGRDGSVTYCFIRMLVDWLNNDPDPSQRKVIAALQGPVMGENYLAKQLLNDQRFMSEPLSLHLLESYLSKVMSKWYSFGIQLGIAAHILDRFSCSGSCDATRLLHNFLLWWLTAREGPAPTMQVILEAMRGKLVGENGRARELECYAGHRLVVVRERSS